MLAAGQNEAAEGRDEAAAGRCWLPAKMRPLTAETRLLTTDVTASRNETATDREAAAAGREAAAAGREAEIVDCSNVLVKLLQANINKKGVVSLKIEREAMHSLRKAECHFDKQEKKKLHSAQCTAHPVSCFIVRTYELLGFKYIYKEVCRSDHCRVL
jgi:hypothetical protein